MFVTEQTSHDTSERRSWSPGTADENDTATLEQQQHAGWRSTYSKHVLHVRHRAHVPSTDGLIEGFGTLQRSEGRAAVRSERRSRSEGTADDDDDTATQEQQQHARWRSTYIEHASHVRKGEGCVLDKVKHRRRRPCRPISRTVSRIFSRSVD